MAETEPKAKRALRGTNERHDCFEERAVRNKQDENESEDDGDDEVKSSGVLGECTTVAVGNCRPRHPRPMRGNVIVGICIGGGKG